MPIMFIIASEPPPGAVGMMTRMGLLGNGGSAACATAEKASSAVINATARCSMCPSPCRGRACGNAGSRAQLEFSVDLDRNAARERGHSNSGAGVAAALRSPQLKEKVGRAVDHLRLLAKIRRAGAHAEQAQRSEEHTSELQSRQYLVCR